MMVLRALGLFVIVVLAVTCFVIAVKIWRADDDPWRAIEAAAWRRGNRRRMR